MTIEQLADTITVTVESHRDRMKINIKFPAWPTLLGLLFIGLKLGNVIAWSWWWVLAPFWLPLGIAFLAATVVFIVALVGGKKPWLK